MYDGTDAELILAVQNGDISAFEALIKRFQYGLHVFALRFVRNPDVASDIVQETFIALYNAIDRVDATRKLSTFLFEIAKNKSLSYLRSSKRNVPIDFAKDVQEEELFIDRYLRLEVIELVREKVSSLPKKYRDVISLFYFEELSYEKTAKILHIPLNTVRTNLKRGKEMLRQLISI